VKRPALINWPRTLLALLRVEREHITYKMLFSYLPVHEHIIVDGGSLYTQESDESDKEDEGESLHHDCALNEKKRGVKIVS
jgi:hypothetical protein